MASTVIANLLKPEVWNQYGVQRITATNAFWRAGVITNMPGIALPNGGGTINLPFFQGFSGRSEALREGTPLAVNNVTAGKQVAPVIARGKAWGSNDLAGVFATGNEKDPLGAIINFTADFWANDRQKELLDILTGVFASAGMAANKHDISGLSGGNERINGTTMIDAAQKLGDAKGKLRAVAMHSATEAALAKVNQIVYIMESANSDRVPTYHGRTVIVDDDLPVDTVNGIYTTYFFGPGAVGYAEGIIGNGPMEQDRDILVAEDVITMRTRFLMHPGGLRWQGTPAGDFPTAAELATGTNWTRVFDPKNIPIVQFKHKL